MIFYPFKRERGNGEMSEVSDDTLYPLVGALIVLCGVLYGFSEFMRGSR